MLTKENKEKSDKPQYWVVGAMWGGSDDKSEHFIRNGIWFLGWEDKEDPKQADRREQINDGDRIAIKQMLGRGSTEIKIKAIGIVTGKDVQYHERENNNGYLHIYVDWKLEVDRNVESKGCFASIHGPFHEDDPWVHKVFHI